MIILRKDLIHEISNLAYVIADVSEGKESSHTLHQTFDICEEGNLDRIDSLLTLAATEVASTLHPLAKFIARKGDYLLIIKEQSDTASAGFTKCGVKKHRKCVEAKVAALIREYMVATVLHGWLSVTLPSAALFWSERKEQTAAALQAAVATALETATPRPRAFSRTLPPLG